MFGKFNFVTTNKNTPNTDSSDNKNDPCSRAVMQCTRFYWCGWFSARFQCGQVAKIIMEGARLGLFSVWWCGFKPRFGRLSFFSAALRESTCLLLSWWEMPTLKKLIKTLFYTIGCGRITCFVKNAIKTMLQIRIFFLL